MNSHAGSSIIFLENEDFHLATGQKGNQILSIHPNLTKAVVFFYINQGCSKCAALMNPYKRLPLVAQTDVKFAIANVQKDDWAIARKSNPTSTPITNVPTFIFYVNGRPYRKYTGPLSHSDSIQHIFNFINEVSASIPEHITRRVKPSAEERSKLKGKVPECTTGIPLYGDEDDLYPEMSEAYHTQSGSKMGSKMGSQQPKTQNTGIPERQLHPHHLRQHMPQQYPQQYPQQHPQQYPQQYRRQQAIPPQHPRQAPNPPTVSQASNPYSHHYQHPRQASTYTGRYNQPQYTRSNF